MLLAVHGTSTSRPCNVCGYDTQHAVRLVEMPQLSLNPPPPTTTATSGTLKTLAVTATAGATIRYTLDASRPTEANPIFPTSGLELPWPGPAINVNVRAFKAGMTPSITNGALLELNYILGRQATGGPYGPGGAAVGALGGTIDSFDLATRRLRGWAVDSALAGRGVAPVTVAISVDGVPVASALANEPRPDLISAGVAPNADHGFTVVLAEAAAAPLLRAGRHVLSVRVIGSPSTVVPSRLPERSQVTCASAVCTLG